MKLVGNDERGQCDLDADDDGDGRCDCYDRGSDDPPDLGKSLPVYHSDTPAGGDELTLSGKFLNPCLPHRIEHEQSERQDQ